MTFDMQAARKIAENCKSKNESVDHDYWNAHAGMVLPAALNEIDRLQLRDAAMQAQIVADVRQQAEQAVSLDAAEALIRKNAETINGMQQEIERLQNDVIRRALLTDCDKSTIGRQASEIKTQANQIATLKVALIQERSCAIKENPNRTIEHSFERSTRLATLQLAQEYPEIFVEEKK